MNSETGRDSELLAILRIGHDTSMRGEGVSIQDALARTRYAELRPALESQDLLPLIEQDPALVEQWVRYSEDKRTSGGWYITEDGRIGRLEPVFSESFGSRERATAEYVVRELDYWLDVGRSARQVSKRAGA